MAEAMVQSSCEKLRSAIVDKATMGLNFTDNLQEMLEQLEAIDAVIPNAEGWASMACEPEDTDRGDVQERQSEDEDADSDDVQERQPEDEGAESDDVQELQPEVEDTGRDDVQELQSEVGDPDRDDVKELQQEVEDAQPDDGQKWLSKVEDAANMVCRMVERLQEMTVPLPPKGKKMARMLRCCENIVIDPESKEIMLNKMKEITEKLKDLYNESVQFDDVADIRALLQAPGAVVGREADLQRILARLSAGLPIGEKGPIILLITGNECIGRATMAALVFNHNRFKCYYRIWINHTSMCDLREIFNNIISQLVPAGEEKMTGGHVSDDDMGYLSLTNRLHELLKGKKVLIVLHNIWSDPGSWRLLKRMLSGGDADGTGVIIIATASYGINFCQDSEATEILGVQPYCLERLSEEMCCRIIKQVAFRSQDHTAADTEYLEWIAPQVAKFCVGRPLIAQLFGAVLQFKQNTKGAEQEDFSNGALQLMLKYMSPDLRLIFDYCGLIFTRAREIAKDDLIHQWIALDLIEPSGTFSAPQLAEQYLKRLLDMSLLQTAKSSGTSANDDTCATLFTMHQAVKERAVHVIGDTFRWVGERNGFYYYTEHFSYASISNPENKEIESRLADQKIRALTFIGCSQMKPHGNLFSSARCLRVLELHESSIRELPESICQLMHLGYLKLASWSGLVTLPESIGDLIKLLHIDLSSCSGLVNLPESFVKLINLEHISLSGCSKLENLPDSFGKLISLMHINLSGCLALANLPKSLGKLRKLEHINLSGCPKLVNLPGSFGKLINLVHISLSGCNGLKTLPGSFGKMTNLVHINLSGCNGLVSLPGSFGELRSLVHINLSGCYGLEELPPSFGKLISLVYINLSGCSGLATLPGSFGALKNLLHIDLSHCYGLSKLPGSFGKLKQLVHLDLSFGSCFEEIHIALDGLINLKYLNLSHPCSYRADYHHLKELMEVLRQFIRLKHLNLSMFLNPIFCNQSEEQNLEYIDLISGLSRLEYLDLSHNVFLCDLPQSLSGLHRLHTLDLSGCIKLKKVGQWMYTMKSLRSVVLSDLESYQFVVGDYNVMNNYGQLVDVRCKELEITCLEKMKSAKEAHRIRLADKQNLQKLKLCWSVSSERSVDNSGLAEKLVPPHSLQNLELHGYNNTCLPSWLSSSAICSFNIVEITMEDIPNCKHLPPLGLLQNLQRVFLGRMGSITKIDAGDLSGGDGAAFPRLSRFDIYDMPRLEEFTTTYCIGGKELLFTVSDKLVVKKCPKMSFVPVPARARVLAILECDGAMDCCQNRAGTYGVEGPSCISSPVTQITELVVERCNVPLSNWCLLNHLPGLRHLSMFMCRNLISSREILGALSSLETLYIFGTKRGLPEDLLGGLPSLRKLQFDTCAMSQFPDSMRYLTSLETLQLTECDYVKRLPNSLRSFSSLRELILERCEKIKELPPYIGKLTNLKDLHILGCPRLEQWCREEDNKKTLGHIRPRFEETPGSAQQQTFGN